MLEGLTELTKDPLKADQIRDLIIKNKEKVQKSESVCGSIKQIYPIGEGLAVACIREKTSTAPQMLLKEKKLLEYLRSLKLPAIRFYGDPFEINPNQHAILIDWIC